MKQMTSAEIRSAFLGFFQDHDHTSVPSSSLVPGNDATLLFTNAGMVQFKDVFLGRETRDYVRAASSQRCVRAGGKHNDLENVGYTARHHTFFEMLGNFSFGDYFKRDAIRFAWDFLVKVLELPPEKLWVTVFEEDDEAAAIWLNEIGVDPDRLSRIGAKDNFWSMGDTGPCGPCSEIFYDHGPDVPGGPPGTPEEDGDRYIEIWNLVFMQYNRDVSGELAPLPKPSVDTGMGLERLAAVLQGVHSNYETDQFVHLIAAVSKLTGTDDLNHASLRVIADHIRSCAFLIVDGVIPSNEGRGYVLRRIIRRAIRHGYKLGMTQPFFNQLVEPLNAEMGEAYPELTAAVESVQRVLLKEEKRFAETLEQGMSLLRDCVDQLSGTEIPGETAFQLYDTYGFPVDLTADFAREQGLTVDMAGFEAAMESQRDRARAASQFGADYNSDCEVDACTEFTGYTSLEGNGQIVALLKEGQAVEQLNDGESGAIVLDQTPFYAESGGQVGDKGLLTAGQTQFQVMDVQKQGDAYLHIGRVRSGALNMGDTVSAVVDADSRTATAVNHSATHLLHAALRQVLGDHVTQKGSLVESNRLRFDFTHYEPMTAEEIAQVEQLVNRQVRMNHDVETRIMDQKAAIEAGAMALFGEKYGDRVRVLSMGDFSTELCGGTHVNRVGDIGLMKIISETGVASGVRRIEAVAGQPALDWIANAEAVLLQVAQLVKGGRDNVVEKVSQLQARNRSLEKDLDKLKSQLAQSAGTDVADQAVEIDGIQVLSAKIEGGDPKSLRDMLDQLKNKLGSAAVVLAAVNDGKISLVAGVSKDQTGRIKAGDLVNSVAVQVGGKGGGRPDMAQAGGNDPAALDAALQSVPDWVRAQLA